MNISKLTADQVAGAAESDEIPAAVRRLVGQLSPNNPPPTVNELAAIIAQPNVFLWLARDTDDGEAIGEVVGMITLATFRTPGGLHARVEDLVVDENARGRRVGGVLLRVALARAAEAGAAHVDLTSRPSREAAHRLYTRAGFVERDTAVYRFDLGSASFDLP